MESQNPEIIEATVVREVPRSRRGLVAWLPFIIATVALIAVGGVYFKLRGDFAANAHRSEQAVAQLSDQVADAGRGVAEASGWRQPLEQLQQDIDGRLGGIANKQSALEQQVAEALATQAAAQPGSDRHWLLREVEYLLTAAELRLQLERDVVTAIAALEAADRRLGDNNDPTLIPLREQIIGSLNALRAIRPPDVPGLALALADIITRVEDLPLKGLEMIHAAEIPGESTASPTGAPSAQEPHWRAALRAMWRDLVALVDVKSMSVPDHVIFDPGKRYLLQQSVRLELAAARLELLRHDTQNFRASLARISDLLGRYYDTQAPEVSAVMETLTPMRSVELAPSLPTLSEPLALLRAQLDASHRAAGPPS